MADAHEMVYIPELGREVPVALHDNGDGTFTRAMYTGATQGAGAGGGPATIADGADVALGSLADTAIVTDAPGTVSGKLRGLIKLLVDKITVKLDAGTNLIGKVGIDQSTANANEVVVKSGTVAVTGGYPAIQPTSDSGPSWVSAHGIAGVPFTSADQHSAAASVTSAPTGGQKLVVTDILVSVDTAMWVTLKEETSAVIITGPYYLPANGTLQLTTRSKIWKLPTADKKLQVLTSVAGNVMADIGYYSEA
jgi:hypothetical protein